MYNIRPYGPGKFNTILDSYVYSVSLDGGCDEEEGSISECGEWFGIMRNGRTIFRDHDPMLETLNEDEQEQLTASAGVVLREDSQGFVTVTYYDNTDALELAWSQIVDGFAVEEEEEIEESLWFASSSGRIELRMTLEQAKSASHSGSCDDDVKALSQAPAIAEQLAKIDPTVLSGELKEYGAWDAEELADHDQNLQRILWLAACDIREQFS
jgi:hypothetical protein